MEEINVARLSRMTELSELYEAIDRCTELERALSRLQRAHLFGEGEVGRSKAELRSICSRIEDRLERGA